MCTTPSSKSGKPSILGCWALPSRTAVVLGLAWLLQACSSAAPLSTAPAPAPGPLGIDVSELTVRDIRAAYAGGEFTAVELTRAFLDRIDRYESHYNALISMNPDALATAAALDEEYASRGPRGPLHGVPVVIKDNLDYGGLVKSKMSALYRVTVKKVPPPLPEREVSQTTRRSTSLRRPSGGGC